MQYENYENDAPYVSGNGYGFFGYPSSMLESAIGRDDVGRFEFYRSRYFGDTPKCLGSNSLRDHVKSKGAKKILKHMDKIGI